MVAFTSAPPHTRGADHQRHVERYDDRIEAFFDSIDPKPTCPGFGYCSRCRTASDRSANGDSTSTMVLPARPPGGRERYALIPRDQRASAEAITEAEPRDMNVIVPFEAASRRGRNGRFGLLNLNQKIFGPHDPV